MSEATTTKTAQADERTWKEKVNDYLVNDGPKLVFIILWLLANIAVMAERYHRK